MSSVFFTFLPFFSTPFTKPASRSFSAMASLKLENGTETLACLTAPAFLRRTMRSATGSDTIIYQLDFLMPGMLPSSASSRKQMRQRLKSRMKQRGRPHLKQRRTFRDENFGFRFAFTIIDFFAMRYAPRKERFEAPALCLSAE